MLELKVLILEFLAVDGLAASAIASCEVTALDHEPFDDSMKARAYTVIEIK